MTNKNNDIGDDLYSKSSITTESLCSECKNEIATDQNQELCVDFLDDNEEVLQTTQSLSQISLGCHVENEQNQLKNLVNLDERKDSSNEINVNKNDDNHGENYFFLDDNQNNVINTIEVEETNSSVENCDNDAINIILKNLNSEQEKKFFCDQEVQTENENTNVVDEAVWDPEFPSGTELEKIDNAVREATITSVSKCKRKLNFDDIDCNFKVAKTSKDVPKPNVNAMVSMKLNRDKYLADLSNDLYVLSTYLHDFGKAFNIKEFDNKIPMKIPAAPTITGYDTQFNGLNQSRFPKLPINIENIDSNKFNSLDESSNLKRGVKTSSRKISNGTLTSKNVKIMNNNKCVGLPKKSFYQTTLKEAFNNGKENKNNRYSSTDYKKSINKEYPINNTKSNGNDKSLDSTSMYNFNPLRSSTVIKKK